MPTLNAFDNGDIRTTILVGCFELWDFPKEPVAPAMTSRRAKDLIKYEEPIVFYGNRVADIRIQDNKVNTLQARMGTGGNNMPLVAQAISFDTQFGSNATTFEDMSPTLKASQQPPSVTDSLIRRLTPIECERLQGFPDDWTAGQSDSQRYKQMGNAVAVPVVEWIIQGICDTI
jgi:site-specific DNA-cytosine methylase